jgi:hypothetical protein
MTSGGWQESTGTHFPLTSVVPCGQTHVPGTAPVTIGGGHTQMPSTFMTCGGGHARLSQVTELCTIMVAVVPLMTTLAGV